MDQPSSIAEPPGPSETIIERRAGWRALDLADLWTHRELLFFLAWRDVKVRYKQTFLGIAWAVLQPVLMMLVFTILFSRMAKVDTGDIPYYLFVYIGVLPWTFFAIALGTSSNSVVESERLITKVYFPRLLIPFGAVGAATVDFAVGSVVLGGLLVHAGVTPTWTWLLVPLFLLGFVIAALGAGTLLSALNVKYRDFRYAIPFLVQLWMFSTPSIFMPISADEKVVAGHIERNAATTQETGGANASIKADNPLRYNPLTGLIAGFRSCILGREIPWLDVAWGFAASIAMFVVGCYVFRRMEGSFADVI